MPKVEVNTKFWHFDQNNSGGSFHIRDSSGIGPNVWIEATDVGHAIQRAEDIGIYFEGVSKGRDCGCCGDRWSEPRADEGLEKIETNSYTFQWHDVVYIHHLDGRIERMKKPSE